MLPGSGSDERAVAPVVAVVLLVGVVTILGAVVATFALDIGEEVQQVGPQTSISFEYAESTGDSADCGGASGTDKLTIEHGGGDTLDPDRITVRGSSVTDANPDFTATCTGLATEVTAGDGFSIAVQPGDTVSVVWVGDDATATLGTWDGPES